MLEKPLSETWGLLEAVAPERIRMHPLGGWSSWPEPPGLALDTYGRRHLLIPVSGLKAREDRHSGGVQITEHALEDEGRQRTYVDLACLKPHLSELFDVLVNEVLAGLRAGAGDPWSVCHDVLGRWRELLDREEGGLSGPEKTAGMFAELCHLREMIRINAGALAVWTGPRGSRHDFAGSGVSMEVKATLTRHGRFFEITSVDQLEQPSGGTLYLATMKLEQAGPDGVSVADLIESVCGMGVERHELLSLVAMAGMQAHDLQAEGAHRYRILENRIYVVTDKFPRVTAGSFVGGRLPPGILRLRYLLDLTAEPPVPLEAPAVQAAYLALAGGI